MSTAEAPKIVRRLAAAEGYLELGLPAYALQELNRIESAGTFEGIAQLLKGEALQAQLRYDEAIPALNKAAELFPAPFNQRAWLGLSRCYREQGREDLAQAAEVHALPADTPPGTELELVILPIFHIETDSERRRS